LRSVEVDIFGVKRRLIVTDSKDQRPLYRRHSSEAERAGA
jgi:hypothetical protein